MIGIVVVSHSHALAEAAVELAEQMVPEGGPRLMTAAGTADGGFGTDAGAISKAIEEVDSGDGVLVVLDIGSAILSSELAVEFLNPSLAERVLVSAAPLVEGLLTAVVAAAGGAELTVVAGEADTALAGKAAHLAHDQDAPRLLDLPHTPAARPRPRRLVWRVTVRNPHGIHVRPAANIVTALRDVDAEVTLANASTGKGPVCADSLSRISALEVREGQILEARISGPQAEAARGVLAELATHDFGEDIDRVRRTMALRSSASVPVARSSRVEGAERRCVLGPVERRLTGAENGYVPQEPKAELDRLTAAVGSVDDFLAGLGTTHCAEVEILEAQRLLLADREMQHDIVARITAGFSAMDAVETTIGSLAAEFDLLDDEYLRARGQDLRSLRRLLGLALRERPLGDHSFATPGVWLLDELDVAGAMQLDADSCLGVITTFGGASGHGVLMALARGIPVLTGHPEVENIAEGTVVAFDPVTDELWIQPDESVRGEMARRNSRRDRAAELARSMAGEAAVTFSGQRIIVGSNVGSMEDADLAAREGADIVGMVRTEVLYATRTDPPTVTDQVDTYVAIGRTMGNRPVTIRVWDPSTDKPVGFFGSAKEANPALGERGMRVMKHHPEVFADQLRAIARASKQVHLRVLLPMITTVAEVRWARQVLFQVSREEGVIPVDLGVMVEVPAAAIMAGSFAHLLDFATIGTNDLSQYTQAADRNNAKVRDLARQDAPAVLELVAATTRALSRIPVGVCGDLASDPAATAQLVARGITQLSVRPGMVAEIKQAVRSVRD